MSLRYNSYVHPARNGVGVWAKGVYNTPLGAPITGADAITRILKQEGVDRMWTIPMNTLEEAAAVHRMRPTIIRQERLGVNAVNG